MNQTVRSLLQAFDALPPADKREVAVEILRRTTSGDELPDDAFDELAAEVFRGYDAEESANASS